MPDTYFPFEVEAAYRHDQDGTLHFIPDAAVPEDWDNWTVLGVEFDVHDYFPEETDVGAGDDWNGQVSSISMRTARYLTGPKEWRWHELHDLDFAHALTHILTHHRAELENAGTSYARHTIRARAA